MITSGELSQMMKLVNWSGEMEQIIRFTLLAWDVEMVPTQSQLEDKITDHLIGALQRLQQQDTHVWAQAYAIDGQRNEYDPESDSVKGRNDIIFQLGTTHSFTWECKVLHRKGKNLYAEYRKDGIMRFVSGKYSADRECGGMIGYVLDGRVKKAQKGIEKEIQENLKALKQSGAKMNPCSCVKGEARLKETIHILPRSFTMVHAFLARR